MFFLSLNFVSTVFFTGTVFVYTESKKLFKTLKNLKNVKAFYRAMLAHRARL